MAYRTLLVHVDNRASSQDRLAYAIALAGREAAELVGLYVVPGTDLAPSTAAMLGSDAVARRLERFSEMQHAAEQRFRDAVAAAGVDAQWRAPAGPSIETAIAHAVGVDESRETSVDERLADTRLRQWLARHDIAIEVEREAVRGVGVGEWLLSRAADLGSDLLVMGGYAHARMRELVLGGVTRTMLGAMTIPVLMAH